LNGALTQRGEPQKAGLPLFFSGLPYSGGKSDFGFNRLLSKQAFKAIYLRSKSSIGQEVLPSCHPEIRRPPTTRPSAKIRTSAVSAALTKTISPGACFAGLEGRLGQNGAEERINLSRGQTCIMS
jgi:hypothetical protein